VASLALGIRCPTSCQAQKVVGARQLEAIHLFQKRVKIFNARMKFLRLQKQKE
jgi:hypothetical protein